MRGGWKATAAAAVLAAIGAAIYLGRSGAERAPAPVEPVAEPAPASGRTDDRPALLAATADSSPLGGAVAEAAAPPPKPGEAADPVEALFQAAIQVLGPELRAISDPGTYLEGPPPAPELPPVDEAPRGRLLDVLGAADPDARLKAAIALLAVELTDAERERVRESFTDLLRALVENTDPRNSALVLAYVLSRNGDDHGVRALADSLRTGVADGVNGFRSGASLVLALVDDPANAPLLAELLAADPDRVVRKHAAVGLGRSESEEAYAALAAALGREPDMEVRAWAALAAGRATPAGAGSAELRESLARDPAGEVRGAAAYALARTEADGAPALLVDRFYADAHPYARIGALAGLASGLDRHGPAAERTAEFLAADGAPWLAETLATSADSGVRFYAAIALAAAAGPAALPALREQAGREKSRWVRERIEAEIRGLENAQEARANK